MLVCTIDLQCLTYAAPGFEMVYPLMQLITQVHHTHITSHDHAKQPQNILWLIQIQCECLFPIYAITVAYKQADVYRTSACNLMRVLLGSFKTHFLFIPN